MEKMIIGIDDTDSNEGMCTTYLMTKIMNKLKLIGCSYIRYPCLVRLNPSIPYKTRGNAALSVKISINSDNKEKIIELVIDEIKKNAMIENVNTNPGVVFILESEFELLKGILKKFYMKSLYDVVSIEEAKNIISKYKILSFHIKNGRGLIGSLAASGFILNNIKDYTYEYLAYRIDSNLQNERNVNIETLIKMDIKTYPNTWDTIDYSKKKNPIAICMSHSKDPVLYGIRGISPLTLSSNVKMIMSENVKMFNIFRSNQSTDAHIQYISNFKKMKNYCSYKIKCFVYKKSNTIVGGHEILKVVDLENNLLTCAAYEQTGEFRKIIRELIPGDTIYIFGSFINGTFNLEKVNILSLA